MIINQCCGFSSKGTAFYSIPQLLRVVFSKNCHKNNHYLFLSGKKWHKTYIFPNFANKITIATIETNNKTYTMIRKLLIISLFIAQTVAMNATPALKVWRTYSQTDGSQVTLMMAGDENFHYFQTTDGYTVVEEKGNYYYANTKGQLLERTDFLAHNAEERSAEEGELLRQLNNNDPQALHRIRNAMPQITTPRKVGEPTGEFVGSKKGLVILVSFDDLDFQSADPNATFTEIMNKEGYTNSFGAIGSVHDYFKDMSNGLFDLTFDVAGPYKAPKSVQYYGENRNNRDQHSRVIELLKFALEAADPEVDYTKYDWDDDGEVDQVYMLYAGQGEASGGESWTIWPHESQLGRWPIPYKLDNIVINTYACGEEVNYNNQLSGLGTFCHEFSHCLGIPDFYDTSDQGGNHGMGTYDVMCGGCYNYNSWIPAAYTGYERHFCGWLSYKELTDPCKVSSLEAIENGGDVFVCYNPAKPTEYYLFEHRNKTVRWDKGLLGRGLLIYHANYIESRWSQNTVNSADFDNQCLAVVPADNRPDDYTENTDVYPYTSTLPFKTYNEFSDTTTPADELFNVNSDGSNLLHIKLSNIKINNSTKRVSFIFNDGTEEYVNPDGIELVESTPATTPSAIYSIDGKLLRQQNIKDLERGLYVIKFDNGQTRKVMVK